MNKRLSKAKLGRTKSHREALMKNQSRSLFTYGFVVTTTPKAKVLKQKTESLLNKVDGEKLESQKFLHMHFGKRELVKKVLDYCDKSEKKVSIVKVAFRDGDNAEMSKVILLGYQELFGKKKVVSKKGKKEDREKEVVQEEKKDFEKLEEKKKDKGLLNIKDRFVKKERARSRSGI